jgi:SAM-dependent methyltransferase
VAGDDHRRVAPAALRNEMAIIRARAGVLEKAGLRDGAGRALELASGTGQHCAAMARVFPGFDWTPSDRDLVAMDSIQAWRDHAGLPNFSEPLQLDLGDSDWPIGIEAGLDLIVAVNLLHISPWGITFSVLNGASRLLAPHGRLVIYGCFTRDDDWVANSNRAFDQSLRDEDPEWGVRDTVAVQSAGAGYGLEVTDVIEMPANNTMMVFKLG